MSGTSDKAERLHQLLASSLFCCTDIYRVRAGDVLQFNGERPGTDWHAHGYFSVRRWMLVQGTAVRKKIFKRRWFQPTEKRTCHSRPPDELIGIGVCTLVLALLLWAWLDGERGLLTSEPAFPDLDKCGSPRTVQRWFQKIVPDAMSIQQAVRLALLERCEPRPIEQLFPCGLPPPEGLKMRFRRGPPEVYELWRALALLIEGSTKIDVPTAVLLAEARGRSDTTSKIHH